MTCGVVSWRGRLSRTVVSTVAVLAAVVGALVASSPPASAAESAPDGLSQETAAASCWEIKQNYPDAKDGVYWLVTPKLVAPQPFYCDQTTDGGGWVLIGRGREGWKEGYDGVGMPEDIRNAPSGTAALKPAQLSAKTVDGLLNGGRTDALDDGIRVRRAMNAAGSAWQEARFSLASADRWVWTFGALHAVKSFRFSDADGTVSGSGGTTDRFGADDAFRGVRFIQQGGGYKFLMGWAFGSGVVGTEDASTFLWSPAALGRATPFAQVFVRPKLTLAGLDFGTVTASGTSAQAQSVLPDSGAMRTAWGVSGLANGRSGETNTEVAAFGQVGSTVYVGGNFADVQQSEAGAGQVEQSYLAGFAVGTGEWVSSFRPRLDGQVKAIAALPDGRVAIGGQFSTVNGVAQAGIAFLDPATGQLAGAQVVAENRATGSLPYVHDLDVQNGYLYVAGAFTHLTAVGSTRSASAWNGGRINLSTGAPDTQWNAALNGTTIAVDASAQGDRTYYAGYFRMKSTTTVISGAALQTAAGAAVVQPLWKPTFSKYDVDASGNPTGNLYQNAVDEVAGRVWLGGSQHSLFSYDRGGLQLTSGNITKAGGDNQTIEHNADGTLIAAGCHCGDYVYEDTYSYDSPQATATEIDKINLIGVWDAKTGRYAQEFSPSLQARAGYGAWASFFDSTGVLWAGGDFVRSTRAGGALQWSGGFVRFAPRDSVAPGTPGAVSATPSNGGSTQTLTWGAVAGTGVVYEVLRGNRVIASTTSASYIVPTPTTATSYFVRARDAAGNRSASTAAFVVQPASPTGLTLIADGGTWTWRYSADPLPATWNASTFDDSSWQAGKGSFARGVASATTDIDPKDLTTRPLSAQFRNSFQVTDAKTVVGGKISVIANDGVVLYLNGTELTRVRMPAGAVTQNTTATAAVSHTSAVANRVVFDVPQGLLVDGKNVLAASVHANYRATADLSFDLSFTARRGQVPGAVTALTGTASRTAATLTWKAPTGAVAPVSYWIIRAGKTVGTVTAPTTTFTESGLAPSTAYDYSVVSVGADGLASAPASVKVTTTAGEAITVAPGSTWSWRYSADPLPATWNAIGFDASSWQQGAAVLARGVAGAATDIDPNGVADKPLSAQFRHSFTVDDLTGVRDGTVTVTADDGVVVYLNGTELGRAGLPTGAITQNTYATAAPRATTAAANQVTFTVPASLLRKGANVLAASVHGNYHGTPDLSFDLSLTAPRG